MAGVYRAMMSDNGKPVIGAAAKMLGVRPNFDVAVEVDDSVQPGTGGLSVAPDWRVLPPFLIPRRLQPTANGARGNNNLSCFRLNGHTFAECQINDVLALRPDSAIHGTIEPIRQMSIAEFQNGLAATRDEWVVDEN